MPGMSSARDIIRQRPSGLVQIFTNILSCPSHNCLCPRRRPQKRARFNLITLHLDIQPQNNSCSHGALRPCD